MTVPTVTLTGAALAGIAPDLTPEYLKALPRQTVRLGRIRPKARPMALGLAHYLDLDLVAKVLPQSVDYAAKAMPSLSRVYLNDQLGDCVIAGKYHAVGVWSGNDTGLAVQGTDQEVLSMYHTICGPGDNGCVITDVLDYMRSRGLPLGGKAHKLDGYVACDWRRQELVKAAIYLFGVLTIGINLPEEWTQNDVWGVTGSRIVGGHDVTCVGYTAQGVQISSWGRIYTITWQAFTATRWLEECYALLGPDWTGDDRLAPSGVNVDALVADLQKIKGGEVPDIDPGPAPPAPPEPPPGPGPAPPPAPPAPTRLFSLTFTRNVPRGGLVGAFRSPVPIPAGKYDVVPAQSASESPDLTYPVEAES
jgi:hypothetical protein